VTVPVAGDTARAIAILGIRLWVAVVAQADERRLELALDYRLDELTHPGFDWIKPIVEKMDRRLGFRLQGRDVVPLLVIAQSPPVCQRRNCLVSAPGDYAILNSSHGN
jgi:hypothetical protein